MIKSWLKRFELPRSINSWLKSRKLEAQYAETVAYYADRSEPPLEEELARRIKALVANWTSSGFRVFFVGTDEQQDKSGFLQALQRIGDVRCFVRSDGAWGQADPAPYAERRANNTRRLEELFLSNAAEGWIPHLLIMQTWACLVEPQSLSRLRSHYGVFIMNVAMDDRHQYWGTKVSNEWDGTYSLIPHIDLTLTAAPDAVSWYRKEGGSALFFPEASDPEIFHPMPHLPKTHDVCFVGGRYGVRERLVAALRNAAVRVSAFGSGWPEGRIGVEEIPKLFAQSKIILGVGTVGHSDDFYALKLRDFDGPMSGSLYLTHNNPDLHLLYDVGREIATYSSEAECVSRVKYFLAHNEEREAIAAAGRLRVEREHTWDERFKVLLDTLGAMHR